LKYEKSREQQEYQKLMEDNSNREIQNELAYKKRFEDFGIKQAKKDKDFYNIINGGEFKRNQDVQRITNVDKMSCYDYYDQREKNKLKKAGVMKEDSYKSMKDVIDQNHRNVQEMGKKRREDAQKSAQELQQYLEDEKQRKINDRVMQQEYRGILETQVKIKNKNDLQDDFVGDEPARGDSSMGEMYMVPGLNSISPYLKEQRKGQALLGEHSMKMKRYIDKNNVSLTK